MVRALFVHAATPVLGHRRVSNSNFRVVFPMPEDVSVVLDWLNMWPSSPLVARKPKLTITNRNGSVCPGRVISELARCRIVTI